MLKLSARFLLLLLFQDESRCYGNADEATSNFFSVVDILELDSST